ncbi:sigma-70 family RNA polymerase sigma factor [Luteolibacter soli]|uniref:Sigma-70 family RNA polymerase sigma factor n=1 Tax=Luteolibacter soli TaxID=3135280 RepID=A0ABU9AZN2_9BACT
MPLPPDSSREGSDVTRVLNAVAAGDDSASATLLESIYGELRRMAAGKMASERSGHTLQATALVHEAWLRLADGDQNWNNRRHFFGAASEAMRRILVENARRRATEKRGGGLAATALDEELHGIASEDEKLLQIHEVLDALETEDPLKAKIVKLRFFAGLDHNEIAALLDLNEKTIRRHWELAKVWLYRAIRGDG